MGFGSYDESEQQQQNVNDEDEDDAITVHEHEYEGDVTVENGDSTDDLLGQLQDIKASKETEDE